MTKIKVFETVKQVLIEKPETRDNDMFLTATIWYRDLSKRSNVGDLSLIGFFHIMKDYKTWGLASYETISRQRRLVQETHVELRGAEYAERHHKRQEVKQDLKAIKAEAIFGNNTTFTPQEEYASTLPSPQLELGLQ
jgi:hypothetical protein